MRKYIVWYTSLSFVVGIFFGFFYETDTFKHITSTETQTLRILAPNDIFPEDLLESYQFEHNLEVQMTYYMDSNEFNTHVSTDSFDIILAPHTKIPEMKLAGKIGPIDSTMLKNLSNISADFRDLPTDPGGRYSVPLVWGINSNKKLLGSHSETPIVQAGTLAKIPLLQSLPQISNFTFYNSFERDRQIPALWIQSFVLTPQNKDTRKAYSFIDFFLARDIAVELATITHKSSTNLAVEQTNLDAKLKPSHLRTQKFASLVSSAQ